KPAWSARRIRFMSTAAPTKPATTATPATPATQPTLGSGYHIARPQGKCFVTGETIEPGQKFMAALRETPVAFERLDISLGAWPTFDRADVIGYWQTVMPRAEQKK